MSDHEAVRELIAAYALDALDPQESARVEEHLNRCSSCRRELDSFLRVTDHMALSATEATPPAGLEERIIRQASQSRQRPAARTWTFPFR